jgi:ketosteroid isomerase-like protein
VRSFVRVLILVLVLASTKGYAGSAEDAGAVVGRWTTAFNSNDVNTLVSLYAPDAVLMGTTGFSLVEGQAAIRDYFSRLATSGDKVAVGEQKVSMLDDNVAYVTGLCPRWRNEEGASGIHHGPGQARRRLAYCSPPFVAALSAGLFTVPERLILGRQTGKQISCSPVCYR